MDVNDLSYLSARQIAPPASPHTIGFSFQRPDDALLIPPSLIRAGSDCRKRFVLYDKMSHDDLWTGDWRLTMRGQPKPNGIRIAIQRSGIAMTRLLKVWMAH